MKELRPHCCLDVQVCLAVLEELAVARSEQARPGWLLPMRKMCLADSLAPLTIHQMATSVHCSCHSPACGSGRAGCCPLAARAAKGPGCQTGCSPRYLPDLAAE